MGRGKVKTNLRLVVFQRAVAEVVVNIGRQAGQMEQMEQTGTTTVRLLGVWLSWQARQVE